MTNTKTKTKGISTPTQASMIGNQSNRRNSTGTTTSMKPPILSSSPEKEDSTTAFRLKGGISSTSISKSNP